VEFHYRLSNSAFQFSIIPIGYRRRERLLALTKEQISEVYSLRGSSPTSRLEDALALVFGRSTADMILGLLEKKGLRRDEIPGNVDQFNVNLAGLLGQGVPCFREVDG
jgi:hypothetical protein